MQLRARLIILLALIILFLFPLLSNPDAASPHAISADQTRTQYLSDLDESTPWWNTTYHYRQLVNLTDTNSTPRVDVPLHMWFSFENNTCYTHSIRVTDANGHEIPSQVYNKTFWQDPDYLQGATVFWYANISADSTSSYWVYFSELTTIEHASYSSVVWFARTSGTLSGKFGVNYWSFRGDWYNVTSYSASGGKITNGAHLMVDDSWNWNWGSNAGSMHWNPDGLAGQNTNALSPIAGTTFVTEEGPLFINYTTQLPFGANAKLNVTYTFYKWGWVTRIYISYAATVSGSGRTDEWVFYPYITTEAVEVAEDLTQTYYSNWAASGNKGKPAGFGWWNPNGISHGTVRISHDSWNTNPSYTNNYDNYYYRWWDQGTYEFWDTVIPTIYAQAGTVLEETCAFAVWNSTEGIDGYMRIFNATSRYLPISKTKGNVSSYSFKINVKDLGGSNIQGVNVSLLDPVTGERLTQASGAPFTELTDSNGNVTFIGLLNQTYRVHAWIDTRTWLQEQSGSSGMNVTWSENRIASGPFTPVGIILDLASIDIHLEDLMGADMASVGSESVRVRVYNASDSNPVNWKYMDYQYTDVNGDVSFTRLPRCDWVFNFSYSDTDTGHIFQETDFAQYVSYSILSSDITEDLSRPNWVLPLITLEFNVKAYDGVNVDDAYVRISKKGTGDPIAPSEIDYYNITHATDATGDVTFYRVLNGTWTVYLYRVDDFGQTAFNDTVVIDDAQAYVQTNLQIPLTWLRVLVEDGNENRVPSAQIDLKVNGALLVTAYTNPSGWHNFTWIKANDSSIPWVYTIFVSKAGQSNSMTVYASFNYLYYNRIDLASLTYNPMYTELNCTASSYSWSYGDNRTFVVGWYNRTGTSDEFVDTALTNYNLGWLNFSIYWQEQLVGIGWWNSTTPSYVAHSASDGIHFTIIIDTLHFKLNASSYPYLIRINASAPGYSTTEIYTVTVVITSASTTRMGDLSDTQYWTDGFSELYSLLCSPFGRAAYNVSDLDFLNYTIYDSSMNIISSGNLIDIGNGIYRFSDAILNNSDVGEYDVVIWLHKFNYQNRTFTFSATINPVTTILSWVIQPSAYSWGSGTENAFLSFIDTVHSASISDPDTITLLWINQDTGQTVVVDSSTSLSYSYARNIVANGTWRIHAFVSNPNCISDDVLSVAFLVSPASSIVTLTSPDTATVEWGSEFAVFNFDFAQVSPSVPIIGGYLIDIAWSGEIDLIDFGDGSYQLRLLSVQEAANYSLMFWMWLENRTAASASISVNVLIPLGLTSDEGLSIQDPIEQYWTRNFTIRIIAGDLSNLSRYVSGVTVIYNFPAGGLNGELFENHTGMFYYFEFPASHSPAPGIYEIEIEASSIGCSDASTVIYIEVLATPTQSFTDFQLLTVYYADVFDLNFSWVTTLDGNDGVLDPDTISISLWKGINQINPDAGVALDFGTGFYSFAVNTKYLSMTADSVFGPTTYYFVVTMSKTGYQTPLAVTIIVLVLETPSEITNEPISQVIWSETLRVRVHLTDRIHLVYIWEDAIVTFFFGSFALNFTSLNNGTFVIEFGSQLAFNSSDTPHIATIQYVIPNYVDGSIGVEVIVNPVPASIILDPLESDYDWNYEFSLSIAVTLDSNPLLRVNVTTVYYYWTNYLTIQGFLTYNSLWSEYQGIVDTGRVPAGFRILNIVAVRQNYSIPVVSINLTINELETELAADVDIIYAIFGVDQSTEVRLSYTYQGNALPEATVTFVWGGLQRIGSWSSGEYVFQFNPSLDRSLTIPGIYVLNFTADLMNYTFNTETILLSLSAATEIVGGPYRVEDGFSFTLIFAYWDTVNNRPVTAAGTLVQYMVGTTVYDTSPTQFNGTHFLITLSSEEIGDVSPDPYFIRIYGSAPGYQNWTISDSIRQVLVYVDAPTFSILGYRIQRATIYLILGMTAFFGLMAGTAIGIRRWRVPHVIKQINRAIKQIESGKVASIEGIKSMGVIISELLAPGLAELDIEAPIIDAISEGTDIGIDDTDRILSEFDSLDIVTEEEPLEDISSEFESELTAELDEILETESEGSFESEYEEEDSKIDESSELESVSEDESKEEEELGTRIEDETETFDEVADVEFGSDDEDELPNLPEDEEETAPGDQSHELDESEETDFDNSSMNDDSSKEEKSANESDLDDDEEDEISDTSHHDPGTS